METTYSVENQTNIETPKRPQFITVLCILSFIGCALAVVGSIFSYITIKASAINVEMMSNMSDGSNVMMNEMQETMIKSIENALPDLIIGLVCAVICLVGVLQIWKLKKMGFYVYVVGELTPPVAGLILAGGSFFQSMGSLFGLLIAIVWVILYAVNLKHLK